MKNPCIHGSILPRGLKCDRGYLVIRIFTNKGPYNKGCGPHTSELEKIARIALNKIREQQYLGTFGLPQKIRSMKFEVGSGIYMTKHFIYYKDPKTNKPRSAQSILNTASHMKALRSFFNDFDLDAITLKDLKNYRQKRLEIDDVRPATVNRDLAVLSSLFSMFEQWIMEKDIDPVKLPEKNPCQFLPDMDEERRERIATIEELRQLKKACLDLGDVSMWSIIETELHTGLRLNDLQKLEDSPIINDAVVLTQGKTGTKISLPKEIKPTWAKVWPNFRSRWEKIRQAANVPDLQFRDLRKTSLQLLESQFTPDQLASKAGHSDSKITKKWYLKGTQAEDIRPMIEATKKILEEL